MNIYITKVLSLLLLGFLLVTTTAISASIPCFESIDCSSKDNKKLLGLFASIIKINTENNTSLNGKEKPSITKTKPKLNDEQQMVKANNKTEPKLNDEQQVVKANNQEKYSAVNLTDFIALNLKKQTLTAILKKLLPHWHLSIDKSLEGITLDIIVQTTRKRAIIDISRAISAKANFYRYTKPLPTLTLLKI